MKTFAQRRDRPKWDVLKLALSYELNMKNNSMQEDKQPFFLKGQFLLAMPDLADPNFSRTVTCISEHTQEGAFGLVINRISTSITGQDIFDELKIEYVPGAELIPVYIGGPVHTGEIFILHGQPFESESCFMITPFLAMSNTLDMLTAIASGKGPKSYIIALGCAGWGPEQLEYEIKENSWLTCSVFEDILFNTAVEAR
ncbi:MAG: YqgE/AlgH family protein, partial [Proteobacteria bacterium]|nr:YqgE/AlgH family protein [Pseudomonadota bacterium]